MRDVCEVCGNDKAPGGLRCIFCGAEYTREVAASPPLGHRVVNIEAGMPLVDAAISRLERELERARTDGVTVLTIIHGYGASGRGGKIRIECRKRLEYLQDKKFIRGFIEGESFSRKNGQTRTLLRRVPLLNKNDNLNRANKGITVVEL